MLFRRAILIIHGFAGGTYDEEDLANYLELDPFYDVFQFTLPGHRKNLSKVKYEEWINYSEDKLKWLIENNYKNIYLIGHSMGGVIATYLATKYKEVKKLVLAAPAFQYLKVENEKLKISSSIKSTPGIVKTYGRDEIISRLLKLNPFVLKEFTTLIKKYYNVTKDLKCPVLIIQGNRDNIVPISSARHVYNTVNSNIKKIVFVDNLTHDVFYGERSKEMFKLVLDFLKNSTSGEYNI